MEERTLPKLLMSKEEADKRLQAQIEEGQQLLNWQIHSGEEMEKQGWMPVIGQDSTEIS